MRKRESFWTPPRNIRSERCVVRFVQCAIYAQNASKPPKSVTTLTFRVKLQLDKDQLRQFEPSVKSGIPGMGYVRLDNNAAMATEHFNQSRCPRISGSPPAPSAPTDE